MQDFDDQEIDLIFRALDTLEKYEAQNQAMGSMLAAVLCPDKETYERERRAMEAKNRQQEGEKRLLAERVVLLKAKLVMMRQGRAANRVIDEAKRGG